MRSGRRWAIAALVALALGLVAGRWLSVFAADRWWGMAISVAAGRFLTAWHLLRLTLEVAGVLVAAAWCTGHLLLVHRAVGSVHIARSVANIEFREALTPRTLLGITVGAGVLLGLLLGSGLSDAWATVALAWHGLTWGVTDPLLGHDIGLYVAQYPAWQLVREFVLTLVVVTLVVVFILYVLIGAIRLIDRRPAITDHARRHLGWLLAAWALCMAWGFALEPYALVADLDGPMRTNEFYGRELVAQVLAGAAVATALLCVVWALRARHTLLLAGWIVLGVATMGGGALVPFVAGPARTVDPATVRRLETIAFGLEGLDEATPAPAPSAVPGARPPSLWQRRVLARLVEADSFQVFSAFPAMLSTPAYRRPVWLATRIAGDTIASLIAVADDRTTASGGPVSYRAGDTLAYPGLVSLLNLPPGSHRPGAPFYVLGAQPRGVRAGGWARRIPLAWALQVGALLRRSEPDERIDWLLSPSERLAHLAPFAEWAPPAAVVVGSNVFWVATGYLKSRTFPVVEPISWRGARVAAVRPGLIGVVSFTGETRIFLREDGEPLSQAWRAITGGLVEPAAALPRAIAQALPYPEEQFEAQALVLGRPHWETGDLAMRPDAADALALHPSMAWSPDTAASELVAVYEHRRRREVSAALVGRARGTALQLALIHLDSLPPLPTPNALRNRWSRFPSFEQLGDSVRESGGRLEEGDVQFLLGRGGLAAYQPVYASRPGSRPPWCGSARRRGIGWARAARLPRHGGTCAGPWLPPRRASGPTIPCVKPARG